MTMTAAQFVKACVQSGYCSARAAKDYTKQYPKALYDETDFEEAYRHDAYADMRSRRTRDTHQAEDPIFHDILK